jgi:hypothetical protein
MDISFKGVTPLVGKPGSISAIKAEVAKRLGEKHPGYDISNATHLYVNRNEDGFLTQNAKSGNEVGFLTTGDNYKDMMFMRHGWGSETAPSRHINNNPILLSNLSDAAQKVINLIISKF